MPYFLINLIRSKSPNYINEYLKNQKRILIKIDCVESGSTFSIFESTNIK
jgi:hypothetical protein